MTKPTAVGDFVWAMADIFISYSRRNKEFVQVLHKALVHSRYDTWVDWEDIAPTTAWWQEIQTGIETAHTFIFVISDASVASKYCRAEVEHAVEYHKRIIPVVRNKDFPREQLPPELAPLQWLLFRPEDDFGTAFDTLVNAINTDLGHQKAHTRLQLRAQEWRQKKQDAGLLLRGSDLDDAEQWLIPAASIEPKPTQVQMEYLAASVKRRRRDNTVQRSAIGGLATLLVATTGAGLGIYGLLRRSTTEALNSGILADSLKAENLMQSNLRFPALIEALGAARRLQNQETRVRPEVRMRAIATLRQALYTVQQKNQWEIHDGFNTASFSADGEMLVSPGQDSTVQLWQRDGTPLQTLKPDLSAINTSRPKIGRVSFSPNGQLIAAEVQPQVQLWRPDGSHVATLSDTHTPFIVDNPIFSPDGNILATPIITDKKERPIALWRSDGTLINRMEGHSDTIWSLAFSPDSNLLASGSQDGTIRLWGRDGTALATLTGHQGEVWHVSFSPDGQLLASGGADGTVRLWGRDGTALATLTGHQGKVWVVNFSPDGQQLASGGLDGTLRLWGRDGTAINTFEGHTDQVNSADFSPDGNIIISSSADETFRLWRRDGSLINTFSSHIAGSLDFSLSPDGKTFASVGHDQVVRLWQLQPNAINTLGSPGQDYNDPEAIRQFSFSPDGKLLATGKASGEVQIWQTDGTPIAILEGHTESIRELVFSPDSQVLASTSQDATVRLWQRDGQPLATLEGHTSMVMTAHWSPDGERLATGSIDRTIKLWQADGTPIATLERQAEVIEAVRWSPDGKLLASGSQKGILRLWQADGTPIATPKKTHGSDITTLRWSPAPVKTLEGRSWVLAAASASGDVELWHPNGTLLNTLDHRGNVNTVEFSADGETLLTASDDGTVRRWQIDGTQLTTYVGHEGQVMDAQFGPEDAVVVSGSKDGTVRLWELEGSVISILDEYGWLLRFSPDGRTLATLGNRIMRLWNFDLDSLVDMSCHWLTDYLNNATTPPEEKDLCADIAPTENSGNAVSQK